MTSSRGFTLLEMMLVLVLLGVSSSLVMLSFPAREITLTREGERLSGWLNGVAERAEREGVNYGVIFSRDGWHSVAEQQPALKDAYRLPAGITLRLSLEGQDVALSSREKTDRQPQVWLYPGGETTIFSIVLMQGKCEWQLNAPGYFVFDTMEMRCNDTES